MKENESRTIYKGRIPRGDLQEYIKRIYAGIPYGIKANLGGETQLTVRLFGLSIKESEKDREYLSYTNDFGRSLADAFSLVTNGTDNHRSFGKVACDINSYEYPLVTYHRDVATDEWENDIVKPYLRHLSSMTEGEMSRAVAISLGGVPCKDKNGKWGTVWSDPFFGEIHQSFDFDCFCHGCYGIGNIDFLNEHHFDYCGLIEKGLAIEADDGIYDF